MSTVDRVGLDPDPPMWEPPPVPPENLPPRDPRIPDLVSLTEAAEILGMSRQAVHKMALGGRLKGAVVGTTWVFRRAAVEAMKPDDD